MKPVSATFHTMISLEPFGLPEVPVIGMKNQAEAAAGLADHSHEAILEVCFVKRGQIFFDVGGQGYDVRGGEVFLTFPGEIHSTGNQPFPRGFLYWIQVRLPRAGVPFLLLEPGEAGRMVEALATLERRHFPGTRGMEKDFAELFRLVREKPRPLRRLSLASRVTNLLLAVCDAARHNRPRALTGDILQAIQLMEEQLAEPLSVEELALRVHLSPSRFKAKFKEQTGLPPGEYLMNRKVELAKERLRAGRDSITEIAYGLGFASPQHFATTFKKFTQKSPSEYRKEAAAG